MRAPQFPEPSLRHQYAEHIPKIISIVPLLATNQGEPHCQMLRKSGIIPVDYLWLKCRGKTFPLSMPPFMIKLDKQSITAQWLKAIILHAWLGPILGGYFDDHLRVSNVNYSREWTVPLLDHEFMHESSAMEDERFGIHGHISDSKVATVPGVIWQLHWPVWW